MADFWDDIAGYMKQLEEDTKERKAAQYGGHADVFGREYMETAHCSMCGHSLRGSGFTCETCEALVCINCVCTEGKCSQCSRAANIPNEKENL